MPENYPFNVFSVEVIAPWRVYLNTEKTLEIVKTWVTFQENDKFHIWITTILYIVGMWNV